MQRPGRATRPPAPLQQQCQRHQQCTGHPASAHSHCCIAHRHRRRALCSLIGKLRPDTHIVDVCLAVHTHCHSSAPPAFRCLPLPLAGQRKHRLASSMCSMVSACFSLKHNTTNSLCTHALPAQTYQRMHPAAYPSSSRITCAYLMGA